MTHIHTVQPCHFAVSFWEGGGGGVNFNRYGQLAIFYSTQRAGVMYLLQAIYVYSRKKETHHVNFFKEIGPAL